MQEDFDTEHNNIMYTPTSLIHPQGGLTVVNTAGRYVATEQFEITLVFLPWWKN